MSEILQKIREAQSHTAVQVAEVALTASVALTGCTGGGKNKTNGGASASPEASKVITNSCGEVDYTQPYSDTHFGAPTATFENQFSQKDSKRVKYTTDESSKSFKTTLAHSYPAVAWTKATFIDTRNAVTPTDLSAANIAKDAQNLMKKYEANPESIKQDVIEVCDAVAPALLSNNKSGVARNLASEVVFKRVNGKLVQTGMAPAATPGVLELIQINPNLDDSSFADRRESLQELAKNAGVSYDGKIVLKLQTGPLMFDISKQGETKPLNIKIDANEEITVKPQPKPGEADAGSNNNSTSNTNTGRSSSTTNGGRTGGTNGTTGTRGTTTGTTPEQNQGPAGGNTPGSGSEPEAAPNGTDNTPGGNTGPTAGPTGPGEASPTPAPRETQPAPEPTPSPAPRPSSPAPRPSSPPPSNPPSSPSPSPKGSETPQNGGTCDPEFNPENCKTGTSRLMLGNTATAAYLELSTNSVTYRA